MRKFMIRKIPIVIALAALGIFVFSTAVMLLWNNILPAVIHVSAITLWQAMGIIVLCKLLFGGRGKWRGGHKRSMHMKWQRMTDEERSRFSASGCYGRRFRGRNNARTAENPVV